MNEDTVSRAEVSVRSKTIEIRASYGDDTSKGTVRAEGSPDIEEMSMDEVALAVAKDLRGECVLSPSERSEMQERFYQSITKLVGNLASRYAGTCMDGTQDLMGDCWLKISKNIARFDPSRATLTTWTWMVCRSILNRRYQLSCRSRSVVVEASRISREDMDLALASIPDRDTDSFGANDNPDIDRMDMVDSIRDLLAMHPEKRELIISMFGDPSDPDFVVPSYVNIREAARSVGEEPSRVEAFMNKVVRPFFRGRYAER